MPNLITIELTDEQAAEIETLASRSGEDKATLMVRVITEGILSVESYFDYLDEEKAGNKWQGKGGAPDLDDGIEF